MQARTLRFLTASLGALAAVGSLMLVTGPATGQTGEGYELSNVRLAHVDEEGRPLDPSIARVFYDFSWRGDAFPGERACVWRVYDAAGNEIGSVGATLTGLDPVNEDVWQDVPVSGTPHSATAICSGGRLDKVARGRYVNNVERVGRAGASSVAVVFGVRWEGGGDPQPQECVVTVTDNEGRVVAEDDFMLYAQNPVARSRQVIPAEGGIGRPSSGEISCRALS